MLQYAASHVVVQQQQPNIIHKKVQGFACIFFETASAGAQADVGVRIRCRAQAGTISSRVLHSGSCQQHSSAAALALWGQSLVHALLLALQRGVSVARVYCSDAALLAEVRWQIAWLIAWLVAWLVALPFF